MFFPHDLDFRGRAYPMHPHLNHMGPDICRGLLCFAEAKPLGLRGIDWLFVQVRPLLSWGVRSCLSLLPRCCAADLTQKEWCKRLRRCMLLLQIANSWGQRVDKLSFRERRHFAEQNLTNIIDSAERPLDRDATRCCLLLPAVCCVRGSLFLHMGGVQSLS